VLRNVDEAARRRFNIVPFDKTPAQADRQLEEKLKAEWPAILRWMIEGCADWQANGLVRPESVLRATADYFYDQDIVGVWLEDEAIVELGNPHRYEKAADLFKSWCAYAKAAGEEPGTAKSFAQHLQRRGLVKTSKKIGGKTYRGWLGVSLERPGSTDEF
jgi:putative DNA primase/helicase